MPDGRSTLDTRDIENIPYILKIMSLLNVVLAIVLPPASIFLNEGMGATLFINILLTLVGWVPGSIHAVWVLSKQGERARI